MSFSQAVLLLVDLQKSVDHPSWGVRNNPEAEARTVRMAGNLGFKTYLVEDCCFTFARADWNGIDRSADEVHAMSLANLDGEYCTVIKSDALLDQASIQTAISSL